jgi:hypothetical protein
MLRSILLLSQMRFIELFIFSAAVIPIVLENLAV